MDFSFTSLDRIHSAGDFQNLLRRGKAYTHQALKLFITVKKTGRTRLGLVVSRKLGDANKRNRLKRRLREIFRLNRHSLSGPVDMIFMPRGKAAALDQKQLEEIVFGLWRKAKLFENAEKNGSPAVPVLPGA